MHEPTSLPALLILGALLLPAAASAQVPAADELRRCSEIQDNDARLQCFDGLTAAPAAIVAPAPGAVRPGAASEQPIESAAPPRAAAAPVPEPEPKPEPEPEPEPEEVAAERFGSEQVIREADPERLVARIVGDFDGWSGDTLFELDNGQVWRQAEFGRLQYRGPPNPEVTIKKGFFGTYRLSVEGTNRWIRVKRVK